MGIPSDPLPITICTVVQNCCIVIATSLVNGTPRFLDPRRSKTPEPIDIKFDRGDYVGDITPHANFGIFIPKGAVVHMRESVIIRVYSLHPLLFSERELKFMFAICHRPSVCRLSVVCL